MARENQGLQISLIVFVMLTIILAVATYLCFRQWSEADARAAKNQADQKKSADEAANYSRELADLRGMVGLAAQEKADTTFADDMKKYGGGYPEVSRRYRPLVEKMQQTINETKDALAVVQTKVAKLEEEFRVREASKEPQIKTIEDDRNKAKADLASEQQKLNTDRERIKQSEAKLSSDLASNLKAADAAKAAFEQKLEGAAKREQQLSGINKKQSEQIRGLISEDFEGALGDVRWVNQRTGTVWINLGRADGLQRQVTFSVYPATASKLAGGIRKASIEVTQVLGDHLSEARVSDDKIIDPIVPGDKIFTPIWTPNEKRHFALAGFMDLNHDGKSDMQTLRDLIAMNGGIVDAYVADDGKLVGNVTENTRYLILGDKPTEKTTKAAGDSFTRIQDETQRYGTQIVQLEDLLLRMGWKNQMNVVQYGIGANARDFAAKVEDGMQKKSIGSVSDVFKERVPPARVPTSAY